MDRLARTANMGMAKVTVQCSADSFVVNQTLVLRLNICGENGHLYKLKTMKLFIILTNKMCQLISA